MHIRNLFLFLTLFMFIGCSVGPEPPLQLSAYYWRTEWHLDSTEVAFLHRYDISKLYCRYFDVVLDAAKGEPMPNATLSFTSSPLPLESSGLVMRSLELVPTVFITEDCMHAEWPHLAERIVERIIQMNATNDIRGVRELQIDCDYTSRSRATFFRFLSEVRECARQQGMELSVTVRLHQLSMPVPPADRGVLMLYNTGDPRRFAERNPVLDVRDVEPYLSALPHFDLPLSAAYPIYQWTRHIYGVRVDHVVSADELLRVKAAVERRRPELSRSIIVYHLDHENINRYDTQTFEKLFQPSH